MLVLKDKRIEQTKKDKEIALGEKLLKGSKAFFIMDDPFIKSDKKRLQKQLGILQRISSLGWQILYFTAKDEVKDLLNKFETNGSYNFIETKTHHNIN